MWCEAIAKFCVVGKTAVDWLTMKTSWSLWSDNYSMFGHYFSWLAVLVIQSVTTFTIFSWIYHKRWSTRTGSCRGLWINFNLEQAACAGWGMLHARLPDGRPVKKHYVCLVNSLTALEDLGNHFWSIRTLWKRSSNLVIFFKHGETPEIEDLKGAGWFTHSIWNH